MDLISTLIEFWSWTGLAPAEILRLNRFGNVLVRDRNGAFWRICPEDLTCTRVAETQAAYDALLRSPDFIKDWNMAVLVDTAEQVVGPLTEGWCYCFKLPPCFKETSYGADNMASAPLDQVIGVAGDMARQIKDIPDGGSIQIVVTD